MQVFEAAYLITGAATPPIRGAAVAVENGLVVDAGPAAGMRTLYPDAARTDLGDAVLLPGLVNAHQHGRGISQIGLGYRDDALEPWIMRRRGRGAPDTYALTRLAALEMLANGVTATLHANYSYATGDYEAELRGAIRAYIETGLRATICVGYADRGGLLYPPAEDAALLAGLSADAQALMAAAKPAYLPLDATRDLMARLQAEYDGHPTIGFAYGPAGPQWVGDDAWRVLAMDCAKHGIGIHFHLLESPAQADWARVHHPAGVLRHLESLGVFEARTSAAHFVHTKASDIADAARLGLTIVANPGSNMRLYNGAPPLAAVRDAGVRIAVGTDNCALDDNEDLLSELRLAGLLMRKPGDDHLAGCRRSLEIATTDGAAAAFMEGVGSIVPGKRADLVALDLAGVGGAYLDEDRDILDAVLARGCGRDVILTMVDGTVRYRRGEADAVRDEARRSARASAIEARGAGPAAQAAAEEIAQAVRAHYAGGAR